MDGLKGFGATQKVEIGTWIARVEAWETRQVPRYHQQSAPQSYSERGRHEPQGDEICG